MVSLALVCYLFIASHHAASDVGFAAMAENDYQYPEMGGIISFPNVITNNGGNYNPTDSVFTCPLDGTYYFAFSVYTGRLVDPAMTGVHIQRDDLRLSEGYCSNPGADPIWIQCGTSAVLNCNMGQRVFVSTAYTQTQVYSSLRSTFSGFLIHTDIPPY